MNLTHHHPLPGCRRLLALAAPCLALSLLALTGAAQAQSQTQSVDFSRKPITLVVPFAPGGGTDSIAREMARHLSDRLKTTIVVDNKGGAGGVIAAASVAKAPADGHTLLFVTSTFVTHAAFDPAPSYHPLKDFAPVAMLGRGPLLVVSSKASGILSLAQLMQTAKKNPGDVTYCSAGPGSINHLAAELYAQLAGVTMTHVPYKGSGPATLDLIAGRTQIFFATVPTIRAQVQEDRVNVLAVTSRTRSSLYPDVPTVMESGLNGYDVSTWWGVAAPAGTPANVVNALNAAINAVSPAIKDRLLSEGATPFSDSPDAFGQMISAELDDWRRVLKADGQGK